MSTESLASDQDGEEQEEHLDLGLSAFMSERQCKRVAGSFLKANGFFHVDEVEPTLRSLLAVHVSQNRS